MTDRREQVYNASVAAGIEKFELEVAVNGIELSARDRELIAAAVGTGASEVLIQTRDMWEES